MLRNLTFSLLVPLFSLGSCIQARQTAKVDLIGNAKGGNVRFAGTVVHP
jgi:hypothetical protein